MRPSVPSFRQLLSLLLVVLAATVCTVCANAADTSANPSESNPAKDDGDPNEDAKTESSSGEKAAPDESGGDKDESKNAGEGGGTSPVISHIIQQAPAVELKNNGDIDPEGDCKKEIKSFCPNVKPGNSYLAECIQNRIEDEEEGATEFSNKVSPKCKDAVIQYKITLATNINYDTEMANACKKDAEENCKDIKDITRDGKIITCLREIKPKLSSKCRDHITRAQLAAAQDYRIDAQVHDFCKMDAYKHCKDVEAGSGRVNACLRENRDEVGPPLRLFLHGERSCTTQHTPPLAQACIACIALHPDTSENWTHALDTSTGHIRSAAARLQYQVLRRSHAVMPARRPYRRDRPCCPCVSAGRAAAPRMLCMLRTPAGSSWSLRVQSDHLLGPLPHPHTPFAVCVQSVECCTASQNASRLRSRMLPRTALPSARPLPGLSRHSTHQHGCAPPAARSPSFTSPHLMSAPSPTPAVKPWPARNPGERAGRSAPQPEAKT